MDFKNAFCLYAPPFSSIGSYMEMVDLAAEYGITQLEVLNLMDLSTPDLEFAKRLRLYADSKGICFPCASLGLDLVGDDHEEALASVKKYVEIAAILGAPYFHHTIALNFEDPGLIARNFDLFYQRGIAAVRELYDYAKGFGIRTVYEDQGFLFNGVENFSRFLKEVDRDVGVVADFGNILFADEQIPEFIRAFRDRIVHVHVKDYVLTPGDSRDMVPGEYPTRGGNYLRDCLVGYGNAALAAGFQALGEMGYQGSISLECNPLGADEELSFHRNLDAVKKLVDTYL